MKKKNNTDLIALILPVASRESVKIVDFLSLKIFATAHNESFSLFLPRLTVVQLQKTTQ